MKNLESNCCLISFVHFITSVKWFINLSIQVNTSIIKIWSCVYKYTVLTLCVKLFVYYSAGDIIKRWNKTSTIQWLIYGGLLLEKSKIYRSIEGRDGTGNGKRPARSGTGREFLTGTGQGFWVFTYFARKLAIKVSFKIQKFFLYVRDYICYRTFIKLLYSVSRHHKINATLHQLTSTSRYSWFC